MKKYALTSASIPKISEGQASILYKCLEPFGVEQTLDDLMRSARKRNYESTFKHAKSTTLRDSILYHLNRFEKEGIIRTVETENH